MMFWQADATIIALCEFDLSWMQNSIGSNSHDRESGAVVWAREKMNIVIWSRVQRVDIAARCDDAKL